MKNSVILEVLSNKKVLCLEDEPVILRNLTESLELFFGEVVSVKDGLEALDEVMTNSYDALILDIEVPNIDGIEIAKKVRQTDQKIPIIILSSHNEQEYLWRAIELKITKYLSKPYSKETFLKALEQIALELTGYVVIYNINDDLKYDFSKKIIYNKNETLHLSKSESKLLEYFLKNKNQTITYDQISEYMWDFESPGKDAIKTIIKDLRKKVGKDLIKNLYGIGYLCEI
ncbi:response regulator transcription factor [Campylobacter hyointestinalis]|uniref:DNA-binding response regulator n=1 Tax=Campylobacter hyointestinalis subsp. hyointestinalis TaxID=91352 RepID=A0A855N7N5_CAMHY|nr:response regulator transcription factor [Campylobacter hyointestinalis]ANE32649.1 two-component system response regulator [Campylobacter hyointestinalis subsp. hyointestinalis LMG 9260]KEA45018.1 NAD(P)H-flavin oxidoreductase [Campylobacter hyointestinalis subsp. hyointestinalis]PPB60065.1 DNA-binding response regulator [Campylobacter hyointestinalis subsp. hyointestinalis]PPB63976.1 DNA-binding response regulator [Campylobacter hyointestinalis subsp. hyointestinalis]PPB72989.1 DNA-binding 